MEKSTQITHSPNQTRRFAASLAKKVLKEEPGKKACILGLVGKLGSGKTTFVQGFAKSLGIKDNILSPTFLIIRSFRIPNPNFKHLFHIDCYRLKNKKELLTLGFRRIISNPHNLVLIEWADKIKSILPRETIWVKFSHISPKQRRISLV